MPPNKPILAADVIQAIENGNKIEAIKRLRETTGLGLKESKEMIEAYEDTRPAGSAPLRKGDSSNATLILVIILLIAGYGLYKMF